MYIKYVCGSYKNVCDRYYNVTKKKSRIFIAVVVALQKYQSTLESVPNQLLPSLHGTDRIAGYCRSLCWVQMICSHWSIVSVKCDVFPMALAVCFTPSVPECCTFLQPLSLSFSVRHTHTHTQPLHASLFGAGHWFSWEQGTCRHKIRTTPMKRNDFTSTWMIA